MSMPGIFTRLAEKDRVARHTSVRNDAIEWNAIVVIVSTVRIVASAEVARDGGCDRAGDQRVRGKRPPEGEPVVDRALALLTAFDAVTGGR